jgi:hypothetical protein
MLGAPGPRTFGRLHGTIDRSMLVIVRRDAWWV